MTHAPDIEQVNCCCNCQYCTAQLLHSFPDDTLKHKCVKHYRNVTLDSCCKSHVKYIHRKEDSE